MPTSLLASPPARPQPRVSTHPAYDRTLAAEALELSALAGLIADPWQVDALDIMCGLRADGRWACFEYAEIVARQNGKGSCLEIRAVAGLLLFGEQLILWSAHEYKTAMEAFRRVGWLLKRLGERVSDNVIDIDGIRIKILNTNGEESYERLDTGARIKFIARSKGSGRGFSGDLNIIDEAFAYTAIQHAALMPTMSARPNPQIIYTSSPPLDGESGEILYSLRHRGDPTAPRGEDDRPWTQDDSLGYRDWGAAGDLAHLDGIDLDDRALWRATNPAYEIRITEETIARERRSLPPLEFGRERLGIWPPLSSVGGTILDPAVWARLADTESKRAGDVVLSADMTPMRDHGTVGLYGLRADGLEHVQLVDYRPGVTWMVDRMVELHAALDPLAWVIDAKNGVAALLDDLAVHGITVPEDPEHPHRGAVLVLDTAGATDAVGQFIDAYRADPPQLRHVDQVPLNAAIRNVKARPVGDQGIAWGRRVSDTDIGPVVAVSSARYGYHAWRDLVGTGGVTVIEGRLYGAGEESPRERTRGDLAHTG